MENTPIASRILERADGSEAIIALFAPQQDGEDWFCRIRIDNFEEMKIYGIDSMQALSLAVTALLTELRFISENCPGQYTFLGSPELDGSFSAD